jgi:hypothetical protein
VGIAPFIPATNFTLSPLRFVLGGGSLTGMASSPAVAGSEKDLESDCSFFEMKAAIVLSISSSRPAFDTAGSTFFVEAFRLRVFVRSRKSVSGRIGAHLADFCD